MIKTYVSCQIGKYYYEDIKISIEEIDSKLECVIVFYRPISNVRTSVSRKYFAIQDGKIIWSNYFILSHKEIIDAGNQICDKLFKLKAFI